MRQKRAQRKCRQLESAREDYRFGRELTAACRAACRRGAAGRFIVQTGRGQQRIGEACLAAEVQLQDLEQLESAGDVYGFGGELALFWSAACWRGAAAISTCRELVWTRRVIIV